MPSTQLNDQQLQQWYNRFTQELREKARIDVNRVEDLGRVKNYAIIDWYPMDNPNQYERIQIAEPTYAFMPHEGTKCLVDRPQHVEYETHKAWLMGNLQTNLSMAHIRNLYEMSRAGTLMVNAPGTGASEMQQVYTDENGNITTSNTIDSYNQASLQAQSEGKGNWAGMPDYVEVPNIKDYTRPPQPTPPKEPKNMKPGFWSWLGHKLHIRTDYTRLMEYNKAKALYDEEMTRWKNIDPLKLTQDFMKADADRKKFEADLIQYRATPQAILHGISGGYETFALAQMDLDDQSGIDESLAYGNIMLQEDEDLKNEHEKTPLGKLDNGLEEVKTQQNNISKRTLQSVGMLLSFEHAENAHEEWVEKGVYEDGDFAAKENETAVAPKMPEYPMNPSKPLSQYTAEELAARKVWIKDMNTMSGIAGFAALAEVAGDNFTEVVSGMLTVGIPGSKDKIPAIKAARVAGTTAVVDYVAGDATQLGKLMGDGLRRLNQELSGNVNLQDEHILGCMFMMDHMMKTLDQKKDIVEKLGLNEAELQEIAMNRALFKAVYRGKEARTALMGHATYKNTLSQDDLKAAATDIIFADLVTKATAGGAKVNLSNPDTVEAVKQQLEKAYDVNKITAMAPEEVGQLALSMIEFNKTFAKEKPLDAEKQQPAQQQERQLQAPERKLPEQGNLTM